MVQAAHNSDMSNPDMDVELKAHWNNVEVPDNSTDYPVFRSTEPQSDSHEWK